MNKKAIKIFTGAQQTVVLAQDIISGKTELQILYQEDKQAEQRIKDATKQFEELTKTFFSESDGKIEILDFVVPQYLKRQGKEIVILAKPIFDPKAPNLLPIKVVFTPVLEAASLKNDEKLPRDAMDTQIV